MPKLTIKDLAIKLDSVGVYLDNGTLLQINNNAGIIDTGNLRLNSYIKTLDTQRIKKRKQKC